MINVGQQYRISVQRLDEDDWTPVIELAAPVEMLRQFAPSAVAAALGTSVAPVIEESIPDAVFDDDKPKRRRRTKAEMEVARAAEAHPAPEIHTEPIQAEVVPDTQIEKPAYNPFG